MTTNFSCYALTLSLSLSLSTRLRHDLAEHTHAISMSRLVARLSSCQEGCACNRLQKVRPPGALTLDIEVVVLQPDVLLGRWPCIRQRYISKLAATETASKTLWFKKGDGIRHREVCSKGAAGRTKIVLSIQLQPFRLTVCPTLFQTAALSMASSVCVLQSCSPFASPSPELHKPKAALVRVPSWRI